VLTRAAARRALAVGAAAVPVLALALAAAAASRAWPAPPVAYTVKTDTGQTGDRAGELAGPGSARDRAAGPARLTGTGGAAIWRPSARGASGAGQARVAALAQLGEIGVPAAWGASRGRGVTVAVLDTGTDPGTPDLAGSVKAGPDYTVGVNPARYRPPHWHGTYIASLIAGHGSGPGRGAGVLGVAPDATVLSVRVVLDEQEPGFPVYSANQRYKNALARGIRYAVRNGAQVINMSLGAAAGTGPLRQAIGMAVSHGVVVIASAGNDAQRSGGFTPYSYPAAYPGVIAVAAVGADGRPASFSDRNSSVVLAAPGVSIVGAAPGGGYALASGTSPAAAFVSGVAALIRSRYPGLGPALVRQALVSSAAHRPPGGYRPGTGFGEVDAPAALAAAGRLAARGDGGAGLGAGEHFGPGRPGPVQVVHRDPARIAGAEHVAVAGMAGFLAAVAVLGVLAGRRLRGRRRA
jgi:subtilisin family serine protease